MNDYSEVLENLGRITRFLEAASSLNYNAERAASYVSDMASGITEIVEEIAAVNGGDLEDARSDLENAIDAVENITSMFADHSSLGSSLNSVESELDSMKTELEELIDKAGTLDSLTDL